MSEIVKGMNIKEFCDIGYLQEANRLFFHPRGLALEVTVDDDDETRQHISGVWDYRDDPEGICFGSPYGQDPEKAARVEAELERHREARMTLIGSVIEPLGWVHPEDLDGTTGD